MLLIGLDKNYNSQRSELIELFTRFIGQLSKRFLRVYSKGSAGYNGFRRNWEGWGLRNIGVVTNKIRRQRPRLGLCRFAIGYYA